MQETTYFPTKEQKDLPKGLLCGVDALEKNFLPSHICGPQMEKRRLTDIGEHHSRIALNRERKQYFYFSSELVFSCPLQVHQCRRFTMLPESDFINCWLSALTAVF